MGQKFKFAWEKYAGVKNLKSDDPIIRWEWCEKSQGNVEILISCNEKRRSTVIKFCVTIIYTLYFREWISKIEVMDFLNRYRRINGEAFCVEYILWDSRGRTGLSGSWAPGVNILAKIPYFFPHLFLITSSFFSDKQ